MYNVYHVQCTKKVSGPQILLSFATLKVAKEIATAPSKHFDLI